MSREELLRQAAAFLVDPKVASTPMAKRIAFLESKGLTAAEIEQAIKQSSSPAPPIPPATYSAVTYEANYPWRDAMLAFSVMAAGFYGIKRLVETYYPSLFQDKQQAALCERMDSLLDRFEASEAANNEALVELRKHVMEIKDEVMKEPGMSYQMETKLNDIQNELKSVKAMMLSRRHFPPAPTSTQVPPVTTIPSWQLKNEADANIIDKNSWPPKADKDMSEGTVSLVANEE